MPRRPSVVLPVVALATLAVAGELIPGATGPGSASASRAAPGFALRQLGGGRQSLAALKGKVVLLSFWTPG